jgi:HAD superfamily hydrolase (TIGR01450 family)
VTNNASRSVEDVAVLLDSLGVPATADDVTTSARAAAQVLARDLPERAPVLVVGAPALRDEVRRVGLTPVEEATDRPLAVVQGFGPQVGWEELAEACLAIRAGAAWVATNTDATLPSPRGMLPGNGSLVAVLTTALGGRGPDTVVGKPSPILFEAAADRRGAQRALVVGDRLDTDIAGAVLAKMPSLLVLTGVSTPEALLRAGVHERPTYVAADTRALFDSPDRIRVPPWQQEIARSPGWTVTREGDRLMLARADGTGEAIDALRALAAAAWTHPEWNSVSGADEAAAGAIAELGLDRFAGWSLRATSAT